MTMRGVPSTTTCLAVSSITGISSAGCGAWLGRRVVGRGSWGSACLHDDVGAVVPDGTAGDGATQVVEPHRHPAGAVGIVEGRGGEVGAPRGDAGDAVAGPARAEEDVERPAVEGHGRAQLAHGRVEHRVELDRRAAAPHAEEDL